MKISLATSAPSQLETECLAVTVIDTGDKKAAPGVLSSDPAVVAAAADLIASGEVTGKIFETVMLHKPAGVKAKRLLFVGGGKAKNFSAYELRKMAGTAVRFLKPKGIRSFAFVAPEDWRGKADQSSQSTHVAERSGAAEAVRAIVEGAFVGNFEPNTYQSDRKDQAIDQLTVVAPAKDQKQAERAIDEARILGESQNFTRELVNEPGNKMTPTELANRAREMVESLNLPELKIQIHDGDFIKEKKMGAFWSVSQGSDEPPALIVMTYTPAGAPEKPVLGLVGKGITFDSGGISIKPADGMEKMKYDMAGGATMIGAMRAIALLKPKLKITAIVLATENMPSGKAQKPGDVQIAMSGKSIEIINTDAEGRLVLADGLFYARQLGCTHLIDAATLTGAVVVALGSINAGIFANDDAMYNRFSQALDKAGEKMWRMPLDDEYKEIIRSNIADIVNSGGRWGGAITAAMFLKEFAEETPWLHLDIAGTAWTEEQKPWIAKGPSGIALRSLVEFARDFADNKG
jgi:leucyl aminopeptidase